MSSPENEKITTLGNEIRTIQERIIANKDAHSKITVILADTEREIVSVEKSAPASIAAEIETKRQDLAASIACGEKTQQDAAAFEKEATAAQKKYESESSRQKALGPLRDALVGLRRKIAALDAERETLLAEQKRTWVKHLRELAEEAGAEYRLHAEQAFKPLLRVVNCGALVHRLEGHPNAIGMGAREFCIPPLGTESTALPPPPKYSLGEDQNLFSVASDENMRKRVDPDEAALFAEFKAAGLEWIGPAPKVVAPVAVVEPAAVNISTKPAGILSTIAEKPRKGPGGAATLVDPNNPDRLRGPGFNPRPTCAEID
jgi:hypothetical protein